MILRNVEDLIADSAFITVELRDSVESTCKLMARANTRAVCVVTDDKLIGVVSEKDIVQKCVAEGLDPSKTQVEAIMTSNVQTIEAKATVAHAIDIMAEGKFHHLPVLDKDRLVGMIYSDDIPSEYRLLHDHFKELRN